MLQPPQPAPIRPEVPEELLNSGIRRADVWGVNEDEAEDGCETGRDATALDPENFGVNASAVEAENPGER